MNFADPFQLAMLTILIPLLTAIVGGGIGWIGKLWRHVGYNRAFGVATVLASAACLGLSIAMVATSPAQTLTRSLSLGPVGTVGFLIDALSIYFILLVNVIAFVASWNAVGFLEDAARTSFEKSPVSFHALVNLFHFTMLLVPLVDNLIALWIAIESTTLVSTMLVGFYSRQADDSPTEAGENSGKSGERDSWEAAWKYLIITSTGIIFALLGTILLANSGKAHNLLGIAKALGDPNGVMNWTFLLKHANELTPDFVKLSFLFILVGYGTKAGFAPMHTWLPDGHGQAPAPISALLSGVLLKSAFYAILRFYTLTNAALGGTQFTSGLLLGAALLSLLTATPFILKRGGHFKRVLAYHSLEHMGIITFGIGMGGPIALLGGLLHALNHALTKSLMFLAFGNILRRYEQGLREINLELTPRRITGVFQTMPWTGAILLLSGLALVGTPPFNIFMSEFIILWGAAKSLGPGQFSPFPHWVTIIAISLFILSTTLIFYGLAGHLARLVLYKSPIDRKLKESALELAPLILLLLIILVLGIWILPPLFRLLSDSVRIIQNVQP